MKTSSSTRSFKLEKKRFCKEKCKLIKKLKNYETYKLNKKETGDFENSFSEFLKLPFIMLSILEFAHFTAPFLYAKVPFAVPNFKKLGGVL